MSKTNSAAKNAWYHQVLERAFADRQNRNPNYSLRAFARHIGLSPSQLSEVFNRKQGLSSRSAKKIATHLNLSSNEAQVFIASVEAEHGRSHLVKKIAQAKVQSHLAQQPNTIQLDAFTAISDWYHFAITELVQTSEFSKQLPPNDRPWISQKLAISLPLINSAIERLLRLKLLTLNSNNQLEASTQLWVTPDGVPSQAIKKFQTQILEMALLAINQQTVEQRNISSIMMPINLAALPQAHQEIQKFRRGFSKKIHHSFAKSKNKNAVYCLSVAFFRLDQKLNH